MMMDCKKSVLLCFLRNLTLAGLHGSGSLPEHHDKLNICKIDFLK